MTRRFAKYGVHLLPVLLAAQLTACGGSGDANVHTGSSPAGSSGPQVRGTVYGPDGRLTQSSSILRLAARLVYTEALALTGNVSPVGRGVTVTLAWYHPSGVIDQNVAQAVTD